MVIEGKEIEIGYGDKIAVHKANIKINEIGRASCRERV